MTENPTKSSLEIEEDSDSPPKIQTVGDLKRNLEKFPDDMKILTSMDPEGNGYDLVFVAPKIVYIESSHLFYGKKKTKLRERWDGDEVMDDYDVQQKGIATEELEQNYTKFLKLN